MKQWFPLILTLLGGAQLCALACSSQSTATQPGPTSAASNDGGVVFVPGPSADAGDGGNSDAPEAPQTLLRIAQLSPDLPPIDVCVAPHGTTAFQGPLIRQLSIAQARGGDPDAAAPGLAYAQVSAYLSLAPGQYDVRVVAAGASSCDRVPLFRPFDDADGGDAGASGPDAAASDDGGMDAVAPDAGAPDASSDAETDAGAPAEAGPPFTSGIGDVSNLPALAFNVSSTLLIAGELSPVKGEEGLTFTVITDDEVLVSGASVLRAVNAVPSGVALDFGFAGVATDSGPAGWLPVLTDVGFAAASAKAGPGEGAVDANGYLPIAPLAGQPMSVRATGADAGADIAAASGINVDLGGIATVIAIGGKTGDTANPPALLLCTDNQPSGGLLSDCSIAR